MWDAAARADARISVVYCLLLGRNLPYWLTTGGYLLASCVCSVPDRGGRFS